MNLYIEFLMKIDLLIHNYFNYYININNIIINKINNIFIK